MQTLMVILIVAAAALYVSWQAYRFFTPKPGGKACGGNCCSAGKEPARAVTATPPAPRTQMITSDSLRARIKARQA